MWKWVFIIIGLLLATGAVLYVWMGIVMSEGTKPKANGKNDYAVVLGAKVHPSGIPSLALKYRLDAAVDYLNEYPHVKIILSGGQGPDEPMSEADFMYTYLTEAGINEERLIREGSSTSTYENLLYSKELMPAMEGAITIISSDFHLARAQFIAEQLELEVDVIAARTPKAVEKKLRFRERFALLKTIIIGK